MGTQIVTGGGLGYLLLPAELLGQAELVDHSELEARPGELVLEAIEHPAPEDT